MWLCNKLSDKAFNVGDKRRMVHYQDKIVSHSICTSLSVLLLLIFLTRYATATNNYHEGTVLYQ